MTAPFNTRSLARSRRLAESYMAGLGLAALVASRHGLPPSTAPDVRATA